MSYADCTHIGAGASSAAWLVTLFPSFTLSFLARRSPAPRATASSLALAASPTAVRALTCHWPCPLASAASVPRLLTRPFIRGSFSLSRSSLLLFLSSSSSPSPSDSRVYSRALTVVSSPSTDTCLIFLERFSCASYPRSEQRKLRIVKAQKYSGLLEEIFE